MRIWAAVTMLSVCPVSSANANLIANGSFETTDFQGWTQSGNVVNVSVECGVPEDGKCNAMFGTASYGGPLGYISQTITTIPGAIYDLSLFEQSDVCCANNFEVQWDGNVIHSSPDHIPHGYGLFDFPGLVASGTSTVVKIGAQNDRFFERIDNIMVDATSTPEPSSAPLVGMALGLLLWVLKERINLRA